MHRRTEWIPGLLFMSALLLVPELALGQSLLFQGARVFTGERVIERADVLVRDGRIEAVGPGLAVPAGAQVISGSGRTLMPGFIDSHTHVFGDALSETLIFGVTTSLDMFTDAGSARGLRAQQDAGSAAARADIISAGTLVTAPGGHGTQFGMPIATITNAADALAFVDARIAEGSEWIKIVYDDGSTFGINWPTLDEATLRAVIAAAHERGRMAVVHISAAADARTALDAGADGLVHIYVDRGPTAEIARLAKERGAFVIPTLVVLQSISGTGGGAPLVDDARLVRYLSPGSRTSLRQGFPQRTGPNAPRYENAVNAVRALHAAGVPILAGSDAPNPGTAHGSALHRELELLVDAGLSPVEALRAATSEPAARFRLADRGVIAVGRRADLLLVEGDPTTDITATRAIVGVWKGGVVADRETYAASLAAATAIADAAPAGLEQGVISDFESGAPVSVFGTMWAETTDQMAGGASTTAISVVDGGAGGSAKALRITGTISAAVPYAWAGATWSPGAAMMQPGDLSSKKEILFSAKGEGASYRLMVFTQMAGMTPLVHEFTAGEEWREIVVPWATLGTDGAGVMAIMFLGGPQTGGFSLWIDDVRLR